jgi:elongation factor G
METPQPIIFVAIEPHTSFDQENLASGFRKLITKAPALQINSDLPTGKTIIRGMAEPQLELVIDRLRREFHVEMTVGRPEVIYRGTLTRVAEGEGRCARRIEGCDQYGHAKIRLKPGGAGSGYLFENQVSRLPKEFVKSIDEGIQEALPGGVDVNFTVNDVRVELYDASFHEVASSEMAFRIAGALALQDAVKRARPALQEPIMKVEVAVPEQYVGDVIGNLNARRGRIEVLESRGATQIIKSTVPLAEMFGYASELRQRTQGQGSYSMHFDLYSPLPDDPR